MSLAQARERVRGILAKKTLGIADETVHDSLQDAIERYLATHCDVKNKPRTAQETRRLLGYLKPIGKQRIASIGTRDLLRLIEETSASISERRHVFGAARAFFRWASRERLIKSSPLQDLQVPGQVTSRDRILTDEEMRRVYKAATELGYQYGYICLVAIHTGMRRGEVASLRWSYITPETITLPAQLTKNKRRLAQLVG